MGKWTDVEAFVEGLRVQEGVVSLKVSRLHEISGDAYPGGEIALLVERQLVNTQYGQGAWKELDYSYVLEAVRDYIAMVNLRK